MLGKTIGNPLIHHFFPMKMVIFWRITSAHFPPRNHEAFAQALLRSPAVVDLSVAFVRPTNDQWLTLFGVTFSPAAGGSGG